MRTLFLTYHRLSGNGGGIYASKAYINAFSFLSEECLLIFPAKKNDEVTDLDCNIKKIKIDISSYSKFRKTIYHLQGKYNYFILNSFKKYMKEFSPDIVVFDNSRISWKLVEVVHNFNCKAITIHHNYEIDFIKGNEAFFRRHIDSYWLKNIERNILLKSDINLFITEYDKKQMQKNYCIDITHHAVLGCFNYKENEKNIIHNKIVDKNNPVFIITGNLSSIQTEKSILNFLDEYYPYILNMLPNHKLLIAGKKPSHHLKNKIKQFINIELIDTPKDMSHILLKADYYISPTMFGSGLKLRLMDGLKFGLPVLAHRVSVRGYECFEEKGYIVNYNDRETFNSGIIKLLNNQYDKNDIYEKYMSVFSLKNGVDRLKSILTQFDLI